MTSIKLYHSGTISEVSESELYDPMRPSGVYKFHVWRVIPSGDKFIILIDGQNKCEIYAVNIATVIERAKEIIDELVEEE
jgi:hypothetical protein